MNEHAHCSKLAETLWNQMKSNQMTTTQESNTNVEVANYYAS